MVIPSTRRRPLLGPLLERELKLSICRCLSFLDILLHMHSLTGRHPTRFAEYNATSLWFRHYLPALLVKRKREAIKMRLVSLLPFLRRRLYSRGGDSKLLAWLAFNALKPSPGIASNPRSVLLTRFLREHIHFPIVEADPGMQRLSGLKRRFYTQEIAGANSTHVQVSLSWRRTHATKNATSRVPWSEDHTRFLDRRRFRCGLDRMRGGTRSEWGHTRMFTQNMLILSTPTSRTCIVSLSGRNGVLRHDNIPLSREIVSTESRSRGVMTILRPVWRIVLEPRSLIGGGPTESNVIGEKQSVSGIGERPEKPVRFYSKWCRHSPIERIIHPPIGTICGVDFR